eukprot:733857-Rhodomonas_salina.2
MEYRFNPVCPYDIPEVVFNPVCPYATPDRLSIRYAHTPAPTARSRVLHGRAFKSPRACFPPKPVLWKHRDHDSHPMSPMPSHDRGRGGLLVVVLLQPRACFSAVYTCRNSYSISAIWMPVRAQRSASALVAAHLAKTCFASRQCAGIARRRCVRRLRAVNWIRTRGTLNQFVPGPDFLFRKAPSFQPECRKKTTSRRATRLGNAYTSESE